MFKGSFHAVWPISIKCNHIPVLLEKWGVLQHVDKAVYTPGRRLFRTIGSRKEANQPHHMKAMLPPHPFYRHLIQFTEPSRFHVEVPHVSDVPDVPGVPPPSSLPAIAARPTEPAEWLKDISHLVLKNKVETLLINKGIDNGYSLGPIRGCEIYCRTDAAGRQCLGGSRHDRNNFVIDLKRSGHAYYRCLSKGCKYTRPEYIGRWADSPLSQLSARLVPMGPIENKFLQELEKYYKGEMRAKKTMNEDDIPGFEDTLQQVVLYLNNYFVFMQQATEYVQIHLDAAGNFHHADIHNLHHMTAQTLLVKYWWNKWLEHPDKHILSGYTSNPTRDHIDGHNFNLAANKMPRFHEPRMQLTDADIAIIQPLLDHQKNVLCKGITADYEYFLKWQAVIARNPACKTGVAPLFQGGQGIGKGVIFGKLFANIWQDLYLQIGNFDSAIANFNAIIANK